MPTQAPGRFWVIMHPSSGGDVIAKFDTAGRSLTPDTIAEYDDFTVVEVADRSELASNTVDQSALTDAEKDRLETVYPVE